MKVIKNSGLLVDFNKDKLRKSLLKSGASNETVDIILNKLAGTLYDGITTKQIYKQAFSLLKKQGNAHAARYNLKSAIQQLGPAGFFFEKFITRIYGAEGYEGKTNLLLYGKCVSHEVDIALLKEGHITFVECKFHNSNDTISDVKVPMYILSRFRDLTENYHNIFSGKEKISFCLIVTNTRFSSDAEAFAKCSNLALLSWDYPKMNSLKDKIDKNGLYPITCLTTLSIIEKEKLLILGQILVSDLINNPNSLTKISLSEKRIKFVLKEASQLCNNS